MSSAADRGTWWKVLLLTAFAVVNFLAGRLWSLRDVREAQRQAGLAEQARLEMQVQLIECRNARVLERGLDPSAN